MIATTTPTDFARLRRERDFRRRLAARCPDGRFDFEDIHAAVTGADHIAENAVPDFIDYLLERSIHHRIVALNSTTPPASTGIAGTDPDDFDRQIRKLQAELGEARAGRAVRLPDGLDAALGMVDFDFAAAVKVDRRLVKVAVHEAAHACAALARGLEVKSAVIRRDGSGLTTLADPVPADVAAAYEGELMFGVDDEHTREYWAQRDGGSDRQIFDARTGGDAGIEDRALGAAKGLLDPLAVRACAILLLHNVGVSVKGEHLAHVIKWIVDPAYFADEKNILKNARAYAQAIRRDAVRESASV